MLSVSDVAERMSVSHALVRQWCAAGELSAVNIGSQRNRHWRIPETAVETFVARRANRPPAKPQPWRDPVPNRMGV